MVLGGEDGCVVKDQGVEDGCRFRGEDGCVKIRG